MLFWEDASLFWEFVVVHPFFFFLLTEDVYLILPGAAAMPISFESFVIVLEDSSFWTILSRKRQGIVPDREISELGPMNCWWGRNALRSDHRSLSDKGHVSEVIIGRCQWVATYVSGDSRNGRDYLPAIADRLLGSMRKCFCSFWTNLQVPN